MKIVKLLLFNMETAIRIINRQRKFGVIRYEKNNGVDVAHDLFFGGLWK